jgi:1,2-phenylacetyl-CoA epoxidase catalytic subunit
MKYAAAQRKTIGDFEVIDYADPEAARAVREALDVPAPITVRWNHWEYASDIAELRRLYEKGKRAQWNATDDLDWSQPVDPDDWIGSPETSVLGSVCQLMGKDEATQKEALFDEVAWYFSQLLHGEQAALQICGQLTNLCPSTDEKFYAASQVADEARHTEVFARLLADKFGTIYPVSPVSKTLLDELFRVADYPRKTLGMQTLFEGFAMGLMDLIRTNLKNPLCREVLRRVQHDEARHAAFGVLTMRRVVQGSSEAERCAMEDWAFDLLEALNANQNYSLLRELGPKYGIEPDAVQVAMLSQPNWADLNAEVYMHTVVPNLVKLGLITERTRARWQELGMLTDIAKAQRGPREPDLSPAP